MGEGYTLCNSLISITPLFFSHCNDTVAHCLTQGEDGEPREYEDMDGLGDDGIDGGGEGGWDVEDDLDLPADLVADVRVPEGEHGFFTPPSKGMSPSQVCGDEVVLVVCVFA